MENFLLAHGCILRAVVPDEAEDDQVAVEKLRDGRQPTRILQAGWALDFKLFLDRIERDFDADATIPLIYDLLAENRHRQCGDALLVIYQNSPPRRQCAVLRSDVWIYPSDERADGRTLIARVHEIAHLCRIPDKRALNFWNGDLAGQNPGKDNLDGILIDRALLGARVHGA